MSDKKEARRSLQAGRATYQRRYTGSLPQEDFERGCKMLGSMLLAAWCLMWAWEVLL